jgi:hypothetical protein
MAIRCGGLFFIGEGPFPRHKKNKVLPNYPSAKSLRVRRVLDLGSPLCIQKPADLQWFTFKVAHFDPP